MASPNKFVAIDLGSSTLKLGVFQYSQGSLTLLDYSITDMGLDPNKEQDRYPFITETLHRVLAEKGIKSEQAFCSISGQFVFTRFVKLPPVAPDQIDQMVVFEAQQNVPFPINEVVWDYQLLGGKGAKDTEAVIVAVKSDLIEQASLAFSMQQLSLTKVDVAPLALVNAYRYNYADNTECALIIDIGAKSTSLVFIEGSKVFCRIIPIGGHMISQNISNEFQEPYIAAELLKKGKGFVGLGGAYADPEDQAAARISKIARSVFSRLHAEISRSISFYRNQQSGTAPKIILLAGGAAAMPYADLFFKEKLNTHVELFNPFKNMGIAPSIDRNKLAAEAYLLGAVSGLGLRVMDDVPMEINLVPTSAAEKLKKKGQMPYLIGAVFVWFLLFALAVGAHFIKLAVVSSEADQIKQDLSNKEALTAAIEKSSKTVSKEGQRTGAVLRVLNQRDYWPSLLEQVIKSSTLYTGLWVTQLDITANGKPVDFLAMSQVAAPIKGRPTPSQAKALRPKPGEKAVIVQQDTFELNLRGFYEASQPFSLLNDFRRSLEDSKLFEKVEIISRESSDNNDAQIALQFYIKAVFKAENKPDLLP